MKTKHIQIICFVAIIFCSTSCENNEAKNGATEAQTPNIPSKQFSFEVVFPPGMSMNDVQLISSSPEFDKKSNELLALQNLIETSSDVEYCDSKAKQFLKETESFVLATVFKQVLASQMLVKLNQNEATQINKEKIGYYLAILVENRNYTPEIVAPSLTKLENLWAKDRITEIAARSLEIAKRINYHAQNASTVNNEQLPKSFLNKTSDMLHGKNLSESQRSMKIKELEESASKSAQNGTNQKIAQALSQERISQENISILERLSK